MELKNAPKIQDIIKIWLALNLSAKFVSDKKRVPEIKPSCTAAVNQPSSEAFNAHINCKSSITPLMLNHNEVPKSCAIAIKMMGPGHLARTRLTVEGMCLSFFSMSLDRKSTRLNSSHVA